MFTNPGFTLADQILATVDLFLKTMGTEACKRRVGLYGLALWNRVKRFERRFLALHSLWKAGRLPKARVRAASGCAVAPPPPQPSPVKGEGKEGVFDASAVDAGSMERARLRPASVLPWGFAWMHKMLPLSAGTLGAYVGSIVDHHPEMKAFVTEVPQAGRLPPGTLSSVRNH